MHTALVTEWGQPPKYVEVATPPPPSTSPSSSSSSSYSPSHQQVRIKVLAAGQHQLVRSRAAGKHYSAQTLPHVPGTDGVGLLDNDNDNDDDGTTTTTTTTTMVYFTTAPMRTGGSFAEYVVLERRWVFAVPEEVLLLRRDRGGEGEGMGVQLAALVNPAMASWMALKARSLVWNASVAKGEKKKKEEEEEEEKEEGRGFGVLILGATSMSGMLAVELARYLGATRVIGAARRRAKLDALEPLDERIVLPAEKVLETDFSHVQGVDVVLDFLYGPVAEAFFRTVRPTRPLEYVHIGSLAGWEISLPGALLRSKDITIRGAGPGSWSFERLGEELPALLKALAGLKAQKIKVVPLKDVEERWNERSDERTVYTP